MGDEKKSINDSNQHFKINIDLSPSDYHRLLPKAEQNNWSLESCTDCSKKYITEKSTEDGPPPVCPECKKKRENERPKPIQQTFQPQPQAPPSPLPVQANNPRPLNPGHLNLGQRQNNNSQGSSNQSLPSSNPPLSSGHLPIINNEISGRPPIRPPIPVGNPWDINKGQGLWSNMPQNIHRQFPPN